MPLYFKIICFIVAAVPIGLIIIAIVFGLRNKQQNSARHLQDIY